MELVRAFSQIKKEDASIAGGKGASLGEMINSGIPVPDGFVILTDTFEKFIKDTDLIQEIDTILDGVDHRAIHTVDEASEKIQGLIKNAEMPQSIADEIISSFEKLNAEFVAVRSSATAEDSVENAWAGQLDSFLNTTQDDLLEKVKKCWASLFTQRAIFYRFEKGLHNTKISVAVVVQKMVNSKMAGIAFSVHPVTQDYNQLIIEAGYGLGEAIVSGQITPDSYVVEKEPRRIIDINIANQSRGLYRVESGGNEWKEISEEEGNKQVLSDEQILKFSDLIIKIENHYGFPCDIEWAFDKDNFYVVQSRPITTLNLDRKPPVLFHKIMARTMFLMDCEIWDIGERINLPKILDGAYYSDPLFYHNENKGIEIYYNFTDPAQAPKYLFDYLNENPDWIFKEKNKFDKDCEEIRSLIKEGNVHDFKKLHKLITDVWPLIAISTIISNENIYPVAKNFVTLAHSIRKESDGVLHWGTEKLLYLAEKLLPEEYKKWVEYLCYSEILAHKFPDEEELFRRKKSFVFYKGGLSSGLTLAQYGDKNNIEIKGYLGEEELKHEVSLRGTVAFSGKALGKVVLVFSRSDIEKVRDGDILVTAMTTPNLISAMNKASAFVTDEGGVTCHAAIVAREMGKPCIIGTKIATKVFKDGDMVEVDADNGIIRIIK